MTDNTVNTTRIVCTLFLSFLKTLTALLQKNSSQKKAANRAEFEGGLEEDLNYNRELNTDVWISLEWIEKLCSLCKYFRQGYMMRVFVIYTKITLLILGT